MVPVSKVAEGLEPLISTRDDDFSDVTLRSVPNVRPSDGNGMMAPLDEDITIGEVRTQVWTYVHETKGSCESLKATEFMGEINGEINVAIPLVTRGRRRLLNAIRESSQCDGPEVWRPTRDPEDLTEKNYCARKLRDFLYKRNITQPDFLEKRIKRH
jgi:hypothetical protein